MLEQHLARTGGFLSVRELKSQCGDAGSLDTFQKYMIKWKAELASGASLVSTIMAMKHQVQANAQICQALLDQILRNLSTHNISGDGASKDPDAFSHECAGDIEAEEMKSAPLEQEALGKDVPAELPAHHVGHTSPGSRKKGVEEGPLNDDALPEVASDSKAVDSRLHQADLFVEGLADGFAANAVARFVPDEAPANELSGDDDRKISLDSSCSRAPAGSQHAAQQEGTDQPDEGEHETPEPLGQICTVHEHGESCETGRLNDTDLASPSLFGEHAREFGSSTQARPIEDGTRACDPRAENSDEQDQENSCSRDVPGSQHAAPRDDANQPDKGEHDTNSGSRHDAV